MRQTSVAEACGSRLHRNLIPKEGSKLREMYDFLINHAGEWTPMPWDYDLFYTNRYKLMDFYGLVIHRRKVSRGKWEVLLEGEYTHNGIFVSYLKVRIDNTQI